MISYPGIDVAVRTVVDVAGNSTCWMLVHLNENCIYTSVVHQVVSLHCTSAPILASSKIRKIVLQQQSMHAITGLTHYVAASFSATSITVVDTVI